MSGVAVMAGALMLAACGSSGSSKASTTTTTTGGSGSSTSQTAAAAGTPVLKTASNTKFGTIVVDTDGRTVYTLTNNGQAVACTGACLSVWPPVLAPAGVTSVSGEGVNAVATAATGAGTQITQAGLPLYRFVNDTAAGDAKGDGITSFGGTWHVVKVGASASTTTTGSSSGGVGGGY
ncbi:MAG: hypothetical protein JOZ99_07380 [Actinobacteria bacterium]|nr:hypothetical protein [Actinomycetota bacterium]